MEDYVFFKTKDPETIELIKVLVRQGRASMVDEKVGKQVCRKSDDEIAQAIEQLLKEFAVKAQWVAVYRVLVDYHGFPSGYKDFQRRIEKIMPLYKGSYPCDEQAIQKGMMSSGILAKPYEKWKDYQPKKHERAFIQQKHTAEHFLKLLNDPTLR